jgi:3-methyladenine DNA glycosylase AlkC
MADIPPDVLADLNAGRIETVTLVEWLAIDSAALLRSALSEAGAPPEPLLAALAASPPAGIGARTRAIGALLRAYCSELPGGDAVWEHLAAHRADTVRAWAAYAQAADPDADLPERLARARRFAADPHMAVREAAWDLLRPHIVGDLPRGLALLEPWVRDPDPNIRRCATEATRPRGVWCAHIEPLKRDPEPALPLLEPVRSDPSDYVRRSVANWLNDASKTRPDWVVAVTDRWLAESPTPETAWTVRHALRTLRRQQAASGGS